MDTAEKMAADIALTMNGGEWKDGKWYSKGHREAWIKAVQPYADEIERLRWENANMEKLWGKSEKTWMEIRDEQDAEIERLRDVLEDLMAVQNGPPLTEFQSEWLQAMIRASDMLYKGTERKGDRGQR